MEVIT